MKTSVSRNENPAVTAFAFFVFLFVFYAFLHNKSAAAAESAVISSAGATLAVASRASSAVSLTAHSVSRQVENAFKWSSASRTPEARIVRFWLELELEFWRSSLSFPLASAQRCV